MSENGVGVGGDDVVGRDDMSKKSSKKKKDKENSPEHGGAVRGLARSVAQRGAHHVAVGRLPVGPHVHGAVSSMASKASQASARAKIQSVAKASENAHKGIEFMEAHHHSSKTAEKSLNEISNKNGSTSIAKKGQHWMSRTSSLVGNLAKNTILGMTVFHTYEVVMARFLGETKESHLDLHDPEYAHGKASHHHESPSPLWQHFTAGLCAGTLHASLGSLMDGLTPKNFASMRSSANAGWFRSAGQAFYPKLLQHSASHAILFGTYETMKRTSYEMLTPTSSGLQKATNGSGLDHENDSSYLFYEKLGAVAIGGVIAGIAQQVVGDVTKQLAEVGSNKTLLAAIKPPSYTPQTLLMVSVPTAIGFVAFEYGRQEEEMEEE